MDIEAFKKSVTEKAKGVKFASCEMYCESGKTFEVMIENGEIVHYTNSFGCGSAFRGVYNQKMGYAYSEKTDDEAALFIVDAAMENAKIIEGDDVEEFYAGDKGYPYMNTYHEALEKTSTDARIAAAKAMENAALEYGEKVSDVNIGIDSCIFSYGEDEVQVSNTNGLDVRCKSNLMIAYISVIAQKGEVIKTAGDFWIGANFSEFDPKALGEAVAKDAVSHLDAKPIKSGKYAIVLKNLVMADILDTFSGVFYGEQAQKGFSMLAGREGEKIAADCVTIHDDALNEEFFGATPFDSEGVCGQNKVVVDSGILKTLLYNLKTAKRQGCKSTGNGFKLSYKAPVQTACTNFYIENGDKSLDQCFEFCHDGLYITEIAGMHSGANMISGDFSLSAEGFEIKDGKQGKAIEQFTIAGNFFELLQSITLCGDDIRFNMPSANGVIGAPSICVNEISVSGI